MSDEGDAMMRSLKIEYANRWLKIGDVPDKFEDWRLKWNRRLKLQIRLKWNGRSWRLECIERRRCKGWCVGRRRCKTNEGFYSDAKEMQNGRCEGWDADEVWVFQFEADEVRVFKVREGNTWRFFNLFPIFK